MVVVVLVVGASGSGSGSASGGYYSILIAKSSRLLGWPDVAIENAAGNATAEGATDTCSGGPTATKHPSAAGTTQLLARQKHHKQYHDVMSGNEGILVGNINLAPTQFCGHGTMPQRKRHIICTSWRGQL